MTSRSFLRLAQCVLVTLLAPALLGQYVERIDVSVANVDVVVTDKSGKVVRGLTRDDFEVLENGKKQAISNFTAYDFSLEEETAAAPAQESVSATPATSTRRRLIVLFLDINDVNPSTKKQFFDGVDNFLDLTLREGDVVSVVSWGHRVRTLVAPTTDRKTVDELIARFARSSRSTVAMTREVGADLVAQAQAQQDLADQGLSLQPTTTPEEEAAFQDFVSGEERCVATKRKVRELRNLLASLGRADLQKIFLLASDDMPLNPAGCPQADAVEDLAKTANAYGITIHGLHPSGARENFAGPDQYVMPGRSSQISTANSQVGRALTEAGGLAYLADRTGGHTSSGPLNSREVLEKVAEESETYYSIGYQLTEGAEDRPRDLKVTTKNKAYKVRTRRNVVRMSEKLRLNDLVVTNLYLPHVDGVGSPKFDAKIRGTKREGKYFVAEILVAVPQSELMFLGDANAKKGSFSVFVAAGREAGDASEVTEVRHDIAQNPQPGTASGSLIPMKIRPDTRRISIAVKDNVTGSVSTKVIDLPRNLLAVLSAS